MNERERQIIQLAKGLLSQRQRQWDEASIDANFLFRFDLTWCKWVGEIRAMMNQLIGKTGDGPLSNEESARWWAHLHANPGTSVGLDSAKGLTVSTARGHYRCLDRELREALERVGRQALHSGDTAALEQLLRQQCMEANQTSKIQDELTRLAKAYHLIPLTDGEAGEYAPVKMREQLQSLLNWVLHGYIVPSFLWPTIRLIESKLDDDGTQTIRPFEWWNDESIDTDQTRLSFTARIRTWTVYYLSKRGGGELAQGLAVGLWNAEFSSRTESVAQYLDEYRRLFDLGARKDYFPKDRPPVFLSHSSKDKPFVRDLAERLEAYGVRVWLDEAEINVGDSLTQKIGQAIDDTDFVVAVLSRNSIDSEWVQRELQIAIQRELAERKVVVLPLLLEPVKIPPFLVDKNYADFSVPEKSEESFARLLGALGVVRNRAQSASEAEAAIELVHEDDSARGSLGRQLGRLRENLYLIEERKRQFVLETDIPLQLVKEERRLHARISALEDQIAGGLGKTPAVAEMVSEEAPSDEHADSQQFEEWIQASRQRWESVVSKKHPDGMPPCYVHGTWMVSYSIIGEFQAPSLRDFLGILGTVSRELPFPQPWWVPTDSRWSTKPYPYNGNIEFWMSENQDSIEPEIADFWRASPAGMMFLVRGYYEDSHPSQVEPGTRIGFDIPVRQMGECLLHAERLAHRLGPASAQVRFQVKWTGLEGRRVLPWPDPSYDLPPHESAYGKPSKQDSVASEVLVPAGQISEALPKIMGNVLTPLDEAFGFLERSQGEIRAALSRFGRKHPQFRPWRR